MSTNRVIQVDEISKKYRLGVLGGLTLRDDVSAWLARRKGKDFEYSNKEFWALSGISFQVNKGDILGIIGRNGAGKSTLLKILSRITSPTSGEVRIKGKVASLLEVGTGFHNELTGRENIFLNGAILGMTKREINSKIDDIISFSGIEHHIDTPVKRYSSGMKVRLGFAVAAFLDPDILIIDEVLAVGDAEFQAKCLGKMREVSVSGRTILFVSHNMAAVQSLCSRAVLLKDGKLLMDSGVEEVITEYGNINFSMKDEIDFSNEEIRSGNGRVKFRGFKMMDRNHNQISVVRTGQDVDFVFPIGGENNKDLSISVYIGLYDSFDNVILAAGSEMTVGTLYFNGGNGELICNFPKFPLMPGVYRLALNCQCNGEISDLIYNAGKVVVEAGDFYNTGKLFPNNKVKILVPHKWQLTNGKEN